MGKRVKIPEAAALTGLSEYTIRTGIAQGRYPHIRTSGNRGKILIDIDLLDQYLEQEARENTHTALDSFSLSGGMVIDYGKIRQVIA